MARMSVGILSWGSASNYLGRKPSRKIGHNTWLESRITGVYESFAIRYHDTDIVTILPDNTYILNSGGYRTATTKQRIAALAPGRLCQRAFQWYVGEHYPHGASFHDGIRLDARGRVVGESPDSTGV